MHRLVFRPFAYNRLPVNPLKVAITKITINYMTSEKQFKVRSLIGHFRDISAICLGRMTSTPTKLEFKIRSETKAARTISIQLSIPSATYGVVLKIP